MLKFSFSLSFKVFLTIFQLFWFHNVHAQLLGKQKVYTYKDSLRGSLNPNRTGFDVKSYDITIKIKPADTLIIGSVTMEYLVLDTFSTMQIDLFDQYYILGVNSMGVPLRYIKDTNCLLVEVKPEMKGLINYITVVYEGKLPVAKRAPWDGGFVITQDGNDKTWVGVACEGLGASSWWPCKDHLSDEPESVSLHISVPTGLKAVSNGTLQSVEKLKGFDRFNWLVKHPINTYNITVNIGDYDNFSVLYPSKESAFDTLLLDFWVLRPNVERARKQFQQVIPMLDCFESKFGPYPFYKDGYKLVETPYLGMEHQSCIAYGNEFKNGYAGNTQMTGGYEFDYIIVHESGHEWYGNNISCKDIADMWIHEAFTTYSESVFVECNYGKKAAIDYINAHASRVRNKEPIRGPLGVNEEGAGDMYAKGSLFINTLRHVIDNDSLWWAMIKKMNVETFRHKTVEYQDIVDFFNQNSQKNCTPLFQQYVLNAKIPELTYTYKKKKGKLWLVHCKWQADAPNFEMPVTMVNSKKGTRVKCNVKASEEAVCVFKGNPKKHLTFDTSIAYIKVIPPDPLSPKK